MPDQEPFPVPRAMQSKMTAVARRPSGKTISIGWTGCPSSFALLSMVVVPSRDARSFTCVRSRDLPLVDAVAHDAGSHVVLNLRSDSHPAGPEPTPRTDILPTRGNLRAEKRSKLMVYYF